MDHDQTLMDVSKFDEALRMCCQAKNQLSKNHGFSPEQAVLGKSTQLPASLSSDDSAAAHSLANGTDLDSQRFQEMLNKRAQARLAFVHADNSEAIRRALLRRSCPVRGPFLPGQLAMYWSKRQRPNRADVGRWCGPAKVILQEGSSIFWVSHADRLLRCAPECLQPASLREWNNAVGPYVNDPISDNPPHNPATNHIPAEYPEQAMNQVSHLILRTMTTLHLSVNNLNKKHHLHHPITQIQWKRTLKRLAPTLKNSKVTILMMMRCSSKWLHCRNLPWML